MKIERGNSYNVLTINNLKKNNLIMKTITRFMYLIFLTTVGVSCTSDDDTGGGEETPQYNLDDLQGKWYRAYSNNPDSDGMEVTVTGDQGKVTNAAGSGFSLNSVKWKDIIA